MKKILNSYKNKVILGFITSNMLLIFGIMFVVLIVIGGGATEEENPTDSTCSVETIPEAITSQSSYIEEAMDEYDIDLQYKNLLMAQLYQESGAKEEILATDPWQSSESYCGEIGCITSPQLSTNQAMSVHRANIDTAVELGLDVNEDLILQSYNFGSGYLYWLADNNYTNSQDIAYEYSSYMTQKFPSYQSSCSIDAVNKKACYGDYKYVEHVNSKLGCSGEGELIDIDDEGLYMPFFEGEYLITCKIGCYSGHKGYDYVNQTDKKIYAVGSGVVVEANNSCPLEGYLGNKCGYGFGNHVIIKHNINGVNLYSIYGHMSTEYAKVGDKVDANTVLGIQGSSGNVTGEHLHLEFRYRTLSPSSYVDLSSILMKRERSENV